MNKPCIGNVSKADGPRANSAKPALGVICTPRGNATERHLFPVLKKYFDIVRFPVNQEFDYAELKRKATCIRIALNTAGDLPYASDSLELTKTFEGMGKRVVDSSKSYYYGEDKWMFYQQCVKHKLPTPLTYYIPRDIAASRTKLKRVLDEGPVVFKGILSDTGKAVKRALTYDDALRVLKTLRKKTGTMPIIAQRYIPHGTVSYRVTLAGDKIIQSIVKQGKNWKEGKLFWKNENYRTFKPDAKLVKLCKKTAKVFSLDWCGIDLMRDAAGKWHLIEVNSCPSMDFVLSDMKRANTALAKYLLSLHQQRK
jgi:glutathione synthase/RimK-type ligase-like ATP-grasp enzyme